MGESKLSVISRRAISYGTEFSAGLTVSFVAMSLGAAFGVQSGRGPLPGILSAGFIALITALFGGTYVQCSGPTAPMTAVTVTLMNAVMKDGLVDDQCGADTECKNKFINMCIVLTGIVLCLCAVIRLGKLITFVPKIVISGFMNGIAVLIWWGEATKIYGIGKPAVGGGMLLNTVIMLSTTAIIFGHGSEGRREVPASREVGQDPTEQGIVWPGYCKCFRCILRWHSWSTSHYSVCPDAE